MASIKDVAKMAGVSVMTASRVVNKNGKVDPELRTAVLRAIKRLGYRPNLNARSLRSKRTHLLGLLIPDIENLIFSTLAKYVEVEAERRGYHVMVGNTWENAEREANYIDIMQSRQMDGLIILPVSDANREMIANLDLPTVVLDRTFSGPGAPPSVRVDNLQVGRMAAEHLLDLQHRHFACITGPLHIDVFAHRYQGFREKIEESGYSIENMVGVEITGKAGYGEEAGHTLFTNIRNHPLALFCANDMIALGAMRAAVKLGLSIPRDVSIIGVDDVPAGELTAPSLTTVRQPFRELAEVGVDVLIHLLADNQCRPKDVLLHPELVPRESTEKYVAKKKATRVG